MSRFCQAKPSLQEFRQPLARHVPEFRHANNHYSLFAKSVEDKITTEADYLMQREYDSGLSRR